jgi:hypothetical protein
VCTVFMEFFLSNTCCNNNNGYTHWFKLNVGSCFRLLWFFRFIPIFSIAFVLLLSCSVVTSPNLVVVVGGVTEEKETIILNVFSAYTIQDRKIESHAAYV